MRRFELLSLLALVAAVVLGTEALRALARALEPSTAALVAWDEADGGPVEQWNGGRGAFSTPPRDLASRPILDPWGRPFFWIRWGSSSGRQGVVANSLGPDADLRADDIDLPRAPRPTPWLRLALEHPRAASAVAFAYLYAVAWWLRLPRGRTRAREVVVAALAGLPLLPLALGLGQLALVQGATPAHLVVPLPVAIGVALWSLAFAIALAIRLHRREET